MIPLIQSWIGPKSGVKFLIRIKRSAAKDLARVPVPDRHRSLNRLKLRFAAGQFPGRRRYGAVAQLGERRVRNAKVVGSNPIGSTTYGTFRVRRARPQSHMCPYPHKIVETLIDAGADVNAKTEDGETALMHAENSAHAEIVEMLREAGARE